MQGINVNVALNVWLDAVKGKPQLMNPARFWLQRCITNKKGIALTTYAIGWVQHYKPLCNTDSVPAGLRTPMVQDFLLPFRPLDSSMRNEASTEDP